MATFIGQLIGFAVIVLIIMKYVVPPVRKLMVERRAAVGAELEESAKAAQRVVDADLFRAQRLEEGRLEASHIIDEAAVDSVRIGEQMRIQGGVEAERIKVQGDQQLLLLRTQLIRELRGELGAQALSRAAEIVTEYAADPLGQSATVDRFLDELESMAAARPAPQARSTDLRPASRDAQAAVVTHFDALGAQFSVAELSQLSDELAAVYTLLLREPTLARYLTETGGSADAKKALLEQLLASKVSPGTLEILGNAVAARWSTTTDFVNCVEYVARLSLLERAEREQQTDEVAEQLFRFGRMLEEQPQLTSLLSDYREPASGRVDLLRSVLNAKSSANPTTLALLAQTVELLHGERVDEAVQNLARLAVGRRGEIVAEVSAAAELSDAQLQRLTEILARIYHHPVSVNLIVGPRLLGGLSVTVGDEVIEGTLSSRLAAAAMKLPN
ncbi:MAG: F0F1 ATP synthase subunit B/delta [Actinomycetota bacterium]|nr:F0F1 ATP synthase subunit B/delta [Actinomycetota bacterium]